MATTFLPEESRRSVSCADHLPYDLSFNMSANGFDPGGASFEGPSDGSLIEISAPETLFITNIDLAMNVEVLVSIVLDREDKKHV
jgi:hypothetical protein